jgi:hypothetical protein
MGLGKKIETQNRQNEQQLRFAAAPVSSGGYNTANIPSLPQAPPMTADETSEVEYLQNKTRQQLTGVPNPSALVKPGIPVNDNPDHMRLNALVVDKIWRIVNVNRLHAFFTQTVLQHLVNRACLHDYRILMQQWGIPTIDIATDLSVLCLYDIVLFADDSSSMNTQEPSEDHMSRWQLMKEVVKTIGFWATLMDEDGIVIRFFNSDVQGNRVGDVKAVETIFHSVHPRGSTPMGDMLQTKVLESCVTPFLKSGNLEKPVLVITITDGNPDHRDSVVQAIMGARQAAASSKYGDMAVAFSFAQIGCDTVARDWLAELDVHPVVGRHIDCTSEYSMEKVECEMKHPGVPFTETTWLIKLLIGAVDPEYDQADEDQQQTYQQITPGQPAPQLQGYQATSPPPQQSMQTSMQGTGPQAGYQQSPQQVRPYQANSMPQSGQAYQQTTMPQANPMPQGGQGYQQTTMPAQPLQNIPTNTTQGYQQSTMPQANIMPQGGQGYQQTTMPYQQSTISQVQGGQGYQQATTTMPPQQSGSQQGAYLPFNSAQAPSLDLQNSVMPPRIPPQTSAPPGARRT